MFKISKLAAETMISPTASATSSVIKLPGKSIIFTVWLTFKHAAKAGTHIGPKQQLLKDR